MKVSASLENYLEEMYELHLESQHIRVTDLSEKIGVSKASVHKAVKILKEQGYVEHQKYGKLDLTDKGLKYAKEVRMHHEILVEFLENVVGVDKETAEDEACKLEHCLSNDTISKIQILVQDKE